MVRVCSTYCLKKNAYRVLVEKPEGKRPLRRHRRKRYNNIKINVAEIGLGYVDRFRRCNNIC
jgi:hypothetical protein